MTLVSQAVFARMCRTTPKTVTKWKQAGKLVLQGLQVDVEATAERMKRLHRGGSPIALTVDEATLPCAKGNAAKRYPADESVTQGNDAPVTLPCTEIAAQLAALDWTQTFEWAPAARCERARKAAECVGWEAVQSSRRDDGHWGGFQLRLAGYAAEDLTEDDIPAGFGYELYPEDVLRVVRSEIDPIDAGDAVTVRPDLLALLAYPFSEHDRPTAAI